MSNDVEDIDEVCPVTDSMRRGGIKRLDMGIWGTPGDPTSRIVLSLVSQDDIATNVALTLDQAKSIATSLMQNIAYAETGEENVLRVKH